ncbi:GNAT family N-acetyltransferase [Sulfitobacter mediterraneus]|uniref:GNAT family N-acetyltransferase n=1 Tax=Sulfitobacter mediterraneus TaxID=83219 RepID=UPI001939B969|nr:GNAT family N-acetyltransferase [Sulfitobacter mediterraneus]MBM1557614.1 GNAT family N-acetyltransferase [Sulfitobacter mediterraneus]MBM1569343.1 GNAT family N-acetyltransferase [Sulfitobacter mediterraneus]MBM1572787.1 GNAT family N-acetyltransferase [Sulfitobacter mediterraneus]MBM1576950.1 GNAT family N-acetyltransferase [Sulfitobacter mediterraneus]MBM1580550.1 GNAT family N-acetyltransferase [Sulfitobacter mediterraneus]
MAKPDQLDVRALIGADLGPALADVARLRIDVFRDWPYLYDGDLAYEESYLQAYRKSDRAIVVGAYGGADLVGASTGTPLADHADDFAAAFDGTGIALNDVFYCAESVLLPAYRGLGIGHRFFDIREAHARRLGFSKCCFCGVVRPADHPRCPATYRPLDDFWRARGYAPLEGAVAQFKWKDIGQAGETAKPLQFWIREL